MATGSGKSLTIYLLMRYFQFKGLKGLLIVPSVSLVQQMSSDFLSYNMKKEDYQKMVHLISAGLPKHFNKDITISTWQSLYKNSELFNSLDYIIVDEAHGVKSNVFENIIIPSAINCGYRFGFTGTLPESFAERMTIVACLGKTEKIITPQGLIERGLATPVEIEMIFINYNNEDKKLVKRMKYQDEIKFIESHNFRNNMIAKIALKVSKKGNTIVLFNTKKHGKLLLENIIRNKFNKNNIYLIDKLTPKYIKDSYEVFKENFKENKDITIYFNGKIDKLKIKKVIQDEEFINSFKSLEDLDIYFIYGDIDKNQREKIRQLLEKKKSAILVASYGTLSTGVNIKRIHNIILSATTKSFIRLNQSIGRGMRLHNEKEKIKIWDITDDFSKLLSNGKRQNLNYALKQSNERISQYLENGYPINEREFELN
jgi:superfamily II DNA or RNA helicase